MQVISLYFVTDILMAIIHNILDALPDFLPLCSSKEFLELLHTNIMAKYVLHDNFYKSVIKMSRITSYDPKAENKEIVIMSKILKIIIILKK